jgi:hypothetical protein
MGLPKVETRATTYQREMGSIGAVDLPKNN